MLLSHFEVLIVFVHSLMTVVTTAGKAKSTADTLSNNLYWNVNKFTTSTCNTMAEATEKRALNPKVSRILAVEGDDNKTNDVLFVDVIRPPNQNNDVLDQGQSQHTVFFGGDVQDYPEHMEFHRDNRRYVMWNLEATAEMLQEKFPKHYIWVIKATAMQLKTFAAYSNFVESVEGVHGCPSHSIGQGSWVHLTKLLKNAAKQLQERGISKTVEMTSDSEVHLVGFSKGCVVLNQLLYDLEEAKGNKDTAPLVHLVKDMYWLDGAHAGGSNTYVNDETVLTALKSTEIKVVCHVTPYQINDSNRKWIAKEHKKFISILRSLSIPVQNTVHFDEEDPSIDNHFKVLTVF